jgi:choline-sulfatase
LIVAGPGIAGDQVTNANVSLHDLCPTLIELAGAESIGAADSKSFASLLADPVAEAGNFTRSYAEFYGTRYLMTQRILWKGPWKFVFNGFDYDELYNLDNDPHELNNLGNGSEHMDRMKSMMAEMWQIMKETGDRILLETHYSPMRFALVGPNAKP